MDSGGLDRRLCFQRRVTTADGYGNETGAWVTQFEAWARLRLLRGGEGVLAARLESRQPAILTVHNSANGRSVTPEWRIVDPNESGRIYNVRENPRRTDDRGQLEMLVESGVAT